MRKTIVILILIYLFPVGYSQIIKGKVMDLNTQAVIDFAAVYFSGTSTGTYTDQKGYFELDISQYKSMPLTISALGYYSITLADLSYNKLYLVYLTPKEYELSEVVITAKNNSLKRRINLNTFKREFLGTTSNARSCYLENENDIMLTFKPKNDTLKAYSLNPITIYNKALGYKLIYYLDKFEYCNSKGYFRIIGNCIFIADTTNFINLQEQFERRRFSTFLGSRMHFFRSLWENNLDQDGFVVTDFSGNRLTSEKLVTQTDSLSKYLSYPGKLLVIYYSGLQQGIIELIKDSVNFDEDGFFDPLGILWEGNMAEKRIGDLLPFEYKPETNLPLTRTK
jgi:hypothetical protein